VNQRDSILVLHSVLGMGLEAVKSLSPHFSPLSAIFGASERELEQISGIGPQRAQRILQIDPFKELERLRREMEEADCQVVVVGDSGFPSSLEGKKGMPAALFFRGDLGCLTSPVVAIVGTRRASGYGGQMAYSMARDLTIQGVMVLSGMAIGIDTFAHRGALEVGPTVAVLGSGIGSIYPPQNKGLAEEIGKRGMLLSPFPPKCEPARWTFPRRNRVMAALSKAVVVVEAGEKSGALLTASYAQELDVPVFAVPGRVDRSQGVGVMQLLKRGAKVAGSAEDVLEHLTIRPRAGAKEGFEEAVELGEKELLVWQALEDEDLPAEVVAQRVGLGLSEIWEVLLEMEIKGLISQLKGGVYSRRKM
jgi:DNA processing protein